MEQRRVLAKLLRRLAACVEESTAEDVDSLIVGRKGLTISSPRTARVPVAKNRRRTTGSRNWAEVARELRDLPSRSDGLQLLAGLGLTKVELERLARALDLPVSRHDDAERLRQKIIEASIGSRLASRAIRGE